MSTQWGNSRTTLPRNERGEVPHAPRGNDLLVELRKSSSQLAKTTSALPPLTTQELTHECQVIALHLGKEEFVEASQASNRAVENIRNGDGGMSLKTFVNACRANSKVRALAAPLLGYGDESDPDVVEAISVLMNKLVRQEDEASHAILDGEGDSDLFGERS